jgi:hypothetical protein
MHINAVAAQRLNRGQRSAGIGDQFQIIECLTPVSRNRNEVGAARRRVGQNRKILLGGGKGQASEERLEA